MNRSRLSQRIVTLLFFSAVLLPTLFAQNTSSLRDAVIQKERSIRSWEDRAMRDSASFSALVRTLGDSDLYSVGDAASALGRIGAPAVSRLMEAVNDARSRRGAIIALEKIGPAASPAVPLLINALQDNNTDIRWAAIMALGAIGPKAGEAVPFLLPLRNASNERTRWAATYALMHIDRASALRAPSVDSVKSFVLNNAAPLMQRYHIPGMSVVLLRDGAVVWSGHFGWKDVRTKVPVDASTMFEACSMTKPLFSSLVMRLVQEGKLSLDEPLSKYLPEQFPSIPGYTTPLTARMVLSHTTGLPNWRPGDEETAGPIPLYSEPGTRFGYSGEAMFYLQRVIEKITGEPLDRYAQRLLFDPGKFSHMRLSWEQRMDSDLSAGHDTSAQFKDKTKYLHPNAAYTLYTSAEEYGKWMGLLIGGKQTVWGLTAETVQQMTSPHTIVDVRDPIDRPGRAYGLSVAWGLGWAVDSTISGPIVYHSGANQSGFRCYAQYRPDDRTGIVIMTNGLNGSDLWRSIISRIGDY